MLVTLVFVLLCAAAAVELVRAVCSTYWGSMIGMARHLVVTTSFAAVAGVVLFFAGETVSLSEQLDAIIAWCATLPDRTMDVAAALGLASIVIALVMGAFAKMRSTVGDTRV